jgi:hypothetical protein
VAALQVNHWSVQLIDAGRRADGLAWAKDCLISSVSGSVHAVVDPRLVECRLGTRFRLLADTLVSSLHPPALKSPFSLRSAEDDSKEWTNTFGEA